MRFETKAAYKAALLEFDQLWENLIKHKVTQKGWKLCFLAFRNGKGAIPARN